MEFMFMVTASYAKDGKLARGGIIKINNISAVASCQALIARRVDSPLLLSTASGKEGCFL